MKSWAIMKDTKGRGRLTWLDDAHTYVGLPLSCLQDCTSALPKNSY